MNSVYYYRRRVEELILFFAVSSPDDTVLRDYVIALNVLGSRLF